MILTDAQGRPIEGPGEPPPKGAPIEDVITWLRRAHEHQDRIADVANRAFARAFRKAIR